MVRTKALLLAGLLGVVAPAAARAQDHAIALASRYRATIAAAAARPQVQSGLGNLRAVGRGDLRFVWSRAGLSIDLRDRHGRWTEPEAVQVRDALDKLPDTYIRKAIRAGLRKIYRDGAVPEAPWDFLPSDHNPSGVAVPPAPWNYVAVGDRLFRDDGAKVYKIVTHEVGHCVQWGISGWATPVSGTPGWTGISWTTGIPTGDGLRSWNGFVSTYARKNHQEDFADACAYYWLAPDELRKASPAKFRYMRDVVFDGLVPPPEAREPERKAIDPVVPEIERLGDRSDDVGSLVQIHGSYFMGPLDGGFNKVRYRGTRTIHLPISRTHLHSWVPAISTGSAPITVTTQDGTSEAAAFTVTKPWWKFW